MTPLLLLAATALAQDAEVSGFVEGRLQVYTGVEADVPVLAVERFRPTFTAPLAERLQLSATIETNLSQGWRANQAIVDLGASHDLDPTLLDQLSAGAKDNEVLAVSDDPDYLSVDRLYLDVYTKSADLRIGRQALNWGSGFVVNPSDPFPEILLTQPWRPRSGVNALKVAVPFGDLNAATLVVASDDAFLHPRIAGRVTVNALNTDWSLVGAWREEADEAIVGLDLKGTLGVGWWFEGVLHVSTEDGAVYEELATGLDYSFPVLQQLIVTAQYYRSGAGRVLDTGGGPAFLAEREPFAPPFSGRDYLMGSVSVGFIPEVSGSALWLQNLGDGSAFIVPAVTTAPTGALEISLAAQIPVALSDGGGEFKPAADDLVLPLPTADGELVPVDFGGVVPSATLILWTRLNF